MKAWIATLWLACLPCMRRHGRQAKTDGGGVDCFARLACLRRQAKTFHFVFVFASEKAWDAFARLIELVYE
ncbi:hypothetical protein A2592_02775 [Candidatus Kaiserbacteria bacterium RIFOXYD1_FULL_42_15]|uniref:Uncharacterized protein n=1 Tax=Candidatus Kaiserbacteria bacterium RIFOXYD1_FULL_42_15 TaxID=1798532 RepID=A0A1F6FU34_9BACT|nr:MAG: hypothetical protein A2592_02775 [Candidatus Kaiserbacteria bacterium RIFOXYD1_FULL_42_15]